MCLGWLAAFYEVPEGLAAPYAAKLGGGAVAAGLLIATSQLGAAVATPIFTKKIGPLTRLKWMGPMAVLSCAVLVAAIARPGLAPSMALFALSNMFAMYQIAANTAFVERMPNERRAQAFGLANAGLVWSGGGFRDSWSGRRGGTSLDGRSSQWGTRCPCRLRSSAPMAAYVACRRSSHCETSWPRGLAYQARHLSMRLVLTRDYVMSDRRRSGPGVAHDAHSLQCEACSGSTMGYQSQKVLRIMRLLLMRNSRRLCLSAHFIVSGANSSLPPPRHRC